MVEQTRGITSQTEAPKHPRLRVFVQALIALGAIGTLGALALFPLDWEDQAIVGGALLGLAWILHRCSSSRTTTLALVVISTFTTVRYLWWRFAETFSYLRYNAGQEGWADLLFVSLLLGAETYAFFVLALGYFQSINPLKRKPVPLPEDTDEWPSVDVLIPTYNEPLSVLKPTVLAAMNMDWPRDRMRVIVLDDGRRSEIRDYAERCGVEYVDRPDNRFAKAGNLNNTLRNTSGEFVAIFDCDHVPTRSFLQMTVGSFLKDERLAMLQTPHHFYTPDPIERNLDVFRKVPNEGSLFYGVIQKGNDFWNATSFAGSCAVLRRTALEEIGGIAVETVTEDAHTSLRMQKRGWNTAYLDIPQASGLAAFTLRDHVNQRIRWARGLTQILRIEKPLWSRELSWPQRLCYFNSAIHFLFAIPRLIFLTAPLGFLILNLSNFYGYVLAILAYALPHLFLATMTNARIQGRHRNPYWNEIFEVVLAPFILLPTTLALIMPRKGVFNVTPKSLDRNSKRYDWAMASPFLVLTALNLAGIGLGVHQIVSGNGATGTILVNLVWACYSTMILGVVLAVAEEPEELRSQPRVPVQTPAFAIAPSGQRFDARTGDISYGGVLLETPDASRFRKGEKVTVGFSMFGLDLRIPGRAVDVDQWSVHVRFATLTLDQEEALTRVIFGRANAWVDWDDSLPDHFSPFRSIGQVLTLSMKGFARVISALFQRPAASRPEAAPEGAAARSQPVLPVLALCVAGGLLGATPMSGQDTAQEEQKRPNAPFSETHRLTDFGLKQPVLLRGANAEGGFRFWMPVTKVVERASLNLRYQVSPPAEPIERTLAVYLNGVEVAALPLDGADMGGGLREALLDLPADLFVGENEASFVLDAACAPDCSGADGEGEIWARVESDSEVRLAGRRLPVALDLRLLPMPFLDLSLHRAPEISIVTSADADSKQLEAAGIAASWIGVLSDHRGARFHARIGEIPPGDAIVIATSGSRLAARLGLSSQTRPAITLLENPVDPYGSVLALVGNDGEALKLAARALALDDYSKEGALAEIGSTPPPPSKGVNDAPRWLDLSTPIPFTDLAKQDELHIFDDSSLDLYVRIPPDQHYGAERRLPLTLRYFVRDLAPTSTATLTLFVNGEFAGEREIAGAESQGETVIEEIFPIPVQSIYPNTTLQFAFRANHQKNETAKAYPVLEILGDSELDLRGGRRFVALPRLDLFANSGFPFTRHADLSETTVVLDESPDSAALSMYFNLMASFGANTGYSGLRVSVMPPGQALAESRDKDLLVIGKPGDAVFTPWAQGLTLSFDRPGLALRDDSTAAKWLRLLSWGQFGRQREELSRAVRQSQQIDVVLEGTASAHGRSVVAVAAASPEAAARFVDAAHGGKGAVYGSVSFLSEDRLQSFTTSPSSHYVGTPTIGANVEFWLRRFLWAFPLLAIAFAFALARVLRMRLEQAAAMRLQGAR